jgi:hypothetical protein
VTINDDDDNNNNNNNNIVNVVVVVMETFFPNVKEGPMTLTVSVVKDKSFLIMQ